MQLVTLQYVIYIVCYIIRPWIYVSVFKCLVLVSFIKVYIDIK